MWINNWILKNNIFMFKVLFELLPEKFQHRKLNAILLKFFEEYLLSLKLSSAVISSDLNVFEPRKNLILSKSWKIIMIFNEWNLDLVEFKKRWVYVTLKFFESHKSCFFLLRKMPPLNALLCHSSWISNFKMLFQENYLMTLLVQFIW